MAKGRKSCRGRSSPTVLNSWDVARLRAEGHEVEGTVLSERLALSVIKPTIRRVSDFIRSTGSPWIPHWFNRLSLWFQRMEAGNRVDDRTPFYHKSSWFWIQKALKGIYTSSGLGTIPQWAREAYLKTEQDQLDSIGPKSLFLPWSEDGPEKLKAVMSDKPKLPGFNEEAWRKALRSVSVAVPKGVIRSISLEAALKGMGGNAKFALDPDTNGAYPGWVGSWANTNRMKVRGTPNETERLLQFRYITDRARSIVKAAQTKPFNELIPLEFIGTTSQRTVSKGLTPLKRVNGKPLKGKRIVIAMPKEEVWTGKTLMAPIQPALLHSFVNSNGSAIIAGWLPQPQLDKTIQLMLESAESQGYTVLSGDISAFDASLPPWAMWDVAQAIATWFNPPDRKLFLSLLYADVFSTRVIAPDGIVGPGPSSVKSGSIFTSLMGCMCNYAIQMYGAYVGHYEIAETHVMGDDFIVYGERVNPETMEKAFSAFGMECNAAKQFYERGCCHFLQRLHVLGVPGGMGSIARIGGGSLVVEDDTQLKFEERNAYAYIFQALARLENAAFNPNFTELVRWLEQGDKRYHLGKLMSTEEISRRAGSYAERKLREAINRPWTSTGSGVPFQHWSVNRVLRGVNMPPPGKERFKFVYGVEYDDVEVDMRKIPSLSK